jgi:hypothetical protein
MGPSAARPYGAAEFDAECRQHGHQRERGRRGGESSRRGCGRDVLIIGANVAHRCLELGLEAGDRNAISEVTG